MVNKKLYKSKEKRINPIPNSGSFNPPLIEHPKTIYFIYLPIIFTLLWYCVFFLKIKLWQFAICFVGALLFWTVFEYILHRYILHAKPTNKTLRLLLYKTHWIHHDYPNDNRFVLMSPVISLLGGLLFYIVCRFLLGSVFCYPVLTSLITIYVMYEWMHFAAHNYNFKNGFFTKLKKHHLKHHFKDTDKGFGFITTQWDEWAGTDFK